MSGLVELFNSILTDYPREYSRDNNPNNPYYIALKKRIYAELGRVYFYGVLEPAFDLDIFLGGEGRMSERAYIIILTYEQKASKGIYPAYSFDAANDEVVFGIFDSDDIEPPIKLVKEFTAITASLLPDFGLSNDGYPVKKYKRCELSERILIDDLYNVMYAYMMCMMKYSREIRDYVKQESGTNVRN